MDPHHESVEHELSPARSHSLAIAALLIALLGLTTLDVAPQDSAMTRRHNESRSIDCIVASAIFAGVTTSQPSEMR